MRRDSEQGACCAAEFPRMDDYVLFECSSFNIFHGNSRLSFTYAYQLKIRKLFTFMEI